MATTLAGSLADVNLRTGVLAKTNGNTKLATKPDDQPLLTQFFNETIVEVCTKVGIVYGVETADDGTTSAAYLTPTAALIPVELNKAVTYKIMSEWFKTIGEAALMNLYESNFNTEIATYRFPPSRDINASRAYRKYKPFG